VSSECETENENCEDIKAEKNIKNSEYSVNGEAELRLEP
jgi:hypothetical protein